MKVMPYLSMSRNVVQGNNNIIKRTFSSEFEIKVPFQPVVELETRVYLAMVGC